MSTTAHPSPGLGLPLRHWPPSESASSWPRDDPVFHPLGSHPNIPGSESVLLPVREVAMMAVKDQLTDKPEWHRKVFDPEIVSKWKSESMAVPDAEWIDLVDSYKNDADVEGWGIMSDAAYDFCIKELQSKARYYERTNLIPTLDASATIVKSDNLVPDALRDALRRAFQRLKDDQAQSPDWHPHSQDMVQDLVHPSMFPLIYGQSKVLKDEVVGISDAIQKWAGKGDTIQKTPAPSGRQSVSLGSHDVPSSYWSDNYQWLPSNVAFQKDGSGRLTSYINNLHPTKYPEIYEAVERLIETAVPAWDQALLAYQNRKHRGPGRRGSRFAIPWGADDECPENWNPPDSAEVADVDVDLNSDDENALDLDFDSGDDESTRQWARNELKWKMLRKPVFREPEPFVEVDYDPYTTPEGTDKHDGGLFRQFHPSGLQIIVKMASIELTPEKPKFPAGGWHVEGLLNEKICATALYYLDSENITDASLAFRMQTSPYDQDELQGQVGQDRYRWLECNYGTPLGNSASCIQHYGSVDTREGRLLVFPNVYQHCVSPFELADPTKPGHRRFIALWLVDPYNRIISTANVPPQQQDWWREAAFGGTVDSRKAAAKKLPADLLHLLTEKGVMLHADAQPAEQTARLPAELMELVRGQLHLGTLSLEEAREHRLRLMEERTSHQQDARGEWARAEYSFCEH